MTPYAQRALAAGVAAVLVWVQSWQVAWGDVILDAARRGQQTGEQQRNQVPLPQVDSGSGTMTLFPGTPAALTLQPQELFPGARGGSVDELKNLFGDHAGIGAAATTAGQRLDTEASATGEAYRTLIQSQQQAHPDLSNDPLWGTTDQTIGALDSLSRQLFGDCTVQPQTRQERLQVHVPDYRTCERMPRLGQNRCEITHTLAAAQTPFTVSVGAWGSVTNTFRFDLKDGSWSQVAPSDGTAFAAQIPVLDPATVCPAGRRTAVQWLEAAHWPEVPVGGNGPFDDTTEYRVLQTPDCDNGLVGIVQLFDPGGEGWYKYAAHFRFTAIQVTTDQWGSEDCLNAARLGSDKFCTVTTQCTLPPDADGCTTVNGVRLCASHGLVGPAPLPGIDPLCRAVQVETDCPFAFGQLNCWTDPQGVQHCPAVNAGNARRDTCAELEQNPACGFIRSDCIDGARGASGECYAYTDVYDCGFNTGGATLALAEATYHCPGPVRCMGEECVAPVKEHNRDFARAAAALQAAQAIATDASCAVPTTGGELSCSLFKGEERECKKALGGVVNCCKSPGGVSLTDYITLTLMVLKLDSAITGWNATSATGQALQGAWMTLREPIAQTWATVTQPFTSAAESIGTTVGQVGIEQSLMNGAAQVIGEVFGAAARDALFTATTQEIGGQMVTNYALTGWAATAASALSVIMWAYMVYQVGMILAQIIWECKTDEFELGAKRELKACHYVGSYCATGVVGQCVEKREGYCCFSSPLSRILQEQIRPQLGMDWGDADDPDCGGIPVERLSQVNWDRVNLDEWVGILAATGRLPAPETLNLERLTGSGNLLNTTGNRPDTQQRTQERIDQVDVDRVRNQVGQDLWGNPGPPQ